MGHYASLALVGALVSCGLQTDAWAQSVVHGQVVDEDLPTFGVADVVVQVEGTSTVVVTDDDGGFVLPLPSACPVTVVASEPDYETVRVEVCAEDTEPILISMRWAGQLATSATVIAPTTTPTTASTVQLTPGDIAAAPHRNAEEVLRQVPGLTLVQHGSEGKGHQFFLRGFDAIHGADLELTVEGVPLNEWSNIHAQGYIDLGILIPEVLSGVRVTKGPFALGQGAFAMAGSAEYQLGIPDTELGGRVSYGLGTTQRHRVFGAYAVDPARFVALEATVDDGFGENRGLERFTLNARERLIETDRGALTVTVLAGGSRFELPGTVRDDDVDAGWIDFFGTYEPRAEGEGTRGILVLRFDETHTPWALEATAYAGYRTLALVENYTGYLVDPVEGDTRRQTQQTVSPGVLTRYSRRVDELVSLELGAGVRGDVFSQREDRLGLGLEVVEHRRDLSGRQWMGHGRVGLQITPLSSLRLDVGLRGEVIGVDATDALGDAAEAAGHLALLAPRASARWQPLDPWRLYAAYGQGFRPPEARAFSTFDPGRTGISDEVYDGGQPSATTSEAMEVGARWDPRSEVGLSVSGFHTRIARESIFDHVSGVNLELNGTRRVGVEAVASVTPWPWLRLSVDVTAVDARFEASGNPIPLAPRWVSGGHLTVRHPNGVEGGLRVLGVSPRPLPHGATGAPLVMTDATLGYRWAGWHVRLEIENLLNRRLREGEYHYASHWRPGEPASELPVLHTTAGPPRTALVTIGRQL